MIQENVKIADLLIRNKADVNAPGNNGYTPLHEAARQENVEIADLLIRNKADVNAPGNNGYTPLHEAENVEIADLLIRNKADVNAPGNNGNTPLHLAFNPYGATPLHEAAKQGNVKVTDLLIRNKADVNAPDNAGLTPLHKAAAHEQVEVIDILIRNNAEVNATDNDGDTPLHEGINSYYNQGNMVMMVESLIRLGANVSVSNNKKATKIVKMRAIIPLSEHKQVLQFSHDNKRSCCDKYSKRKNAQKSKRAPMALVGAKGPMERIATDILGELLETESSNKHVSVVSDYYTKWTESFAMPNMEAKTVAKMCFFIFIFRFYNFHFNEFQGATPLHKAVKLGEVEVTDLLIRHKAYINAPDNVLKIQSKHILRQSLSREMEETLSHPDSK
ncbi:unnamed protein product [Mytilus edulis]|uniref:Uncharacterized protein n=1 Tax=Mytilus edulis TaxID=6550 RepID=A0A8S3VBC7_MYTED|nr:unnamed protein product [Mytilus edulis]